MPSQPRKKNDAIINLLRSVGARVTPARIRVLQLLSNSPTPLSHSEIETTLGHPTIDRVTLYRVLDHLVECGLALKNTDANRVFRFSPAPSGEHASHVHFHCESCGGVFCLDAPPPCAPELPSGFELNRMDFDLRGACARCKGDTTSQKK